MTDLFANDPSISSAHAATMDAHTPLAERLRPQNLSEVIGQKHLLGEGQPLAVAFAQRRMHSMIFWGRQVWEKPRWRGWWRIPSMRISSHSQRYYPA